MTDETKPNGQPAPPASVEPVRGPDSGIPVPDSAVERHLHEAAEHVKPQPGDVPHKRPSADPEEIADPYKPEK
ncbi:hypothetical protein [Azospirillum sp. sgz301742]